MVEILLIIFSHKYVLQSSGKHKFYWNTYIVYIEFKYYLQQRVQLNFKVKLNRNKRLKHWK